jgi:hypothetical protein
MQSGSILNLTGHQKILLAQIVNAPDSPKGGKRIHINDDKMEIAKETLIQLELITYDTETKLFDITDDAITLMQEEGIVDESGELTEIGKEFAGGILSTAVPSKSGTSPMERLTFKDYLQLVEFESHRLG